VGRTADLAGQNYKKSVYPSEIKHYGAADYEFDVILIKFKMADKKWRTFFEKN
jgi:hypothetical protein